MEKFNPSFSFGIVSSRKFFEKLEEEYKAFDKDHISARHAINCALTSWHLTDWTYSEFFKNNELFQDSDSIKKKDGKEYLITITGVTKYQNHLIKICEELKYMRLIANGSKHCILRNAQIKEKTVQHQGDFSFEDFDRNDFDVDRFEILLDNNKKIDFEDTLIKTISFWKSYINECERNGK